MQRTQTIQVLFIDDNKNLGELFCLLLEAKGGFTVHVCNSAAEGLDYISENLIDAIISDYSMPEMDGIEFLKQIRKILPDIPFIMLTGEDTKETAINALNAGADFYQNKSDELDIQIIDIAHKVRVLVAQREAEKAVQRKDAILEAISYAADQFLKGNVLQIDSQDILGRLGIATQADQVCLYNIKESRENGQVLYENSAKWALQPFFFNLSPILWPERWHQILTKTHLFQGDKLELPADESEILEKTQVESILVLPIYANTLHCGYLVFIDNTIKIRRTPIEIQTLRMAAEIIGSARYRRHIEEFFKCPVEEAILGVFLLCGDEFRYVNPKICSIFGYRQEELLRLKNPLSLIRVEDREMVKKHLYLTHQGSLPTQHFECIGVRKDGSEIFIEIYLTTITCHGSRCVAGNLIDVTDRRKIQQSLQESEQRYRRLAEQLDDLILVIDANWQISYLNPAALSAFRIESSIIGTDLRIILQNETFSGLINEIAESMQDGTVRTWSMHINLEQGTTWFDITITPLKVDETQISSVVIYFHDVSFRVQREEEIRRTGLAQLELNMEQFQILNDEIRNPLQVIKGLNHLQGGEFTEQIENQLSIINGLIDKLDRAWVQSEKVHKFLLRHYEHGLFIGNDEK